MDFVTANAELPELDQLFANRGFTPANDLELERRALGGGLEASRVELVVARFRDGAGKRQMFSFVAKRVSGRALREIGVYRDLLGKLGPDVGPRLFHAATYQDDAVLYLEVIPRGRAWPWRDVEQSSGVLERAARVHQLVISFEFERGWSYEEELAASAESSREALDACRGDAELGPLARRYPALQRLVLSLPRVRAELCSGPFGRAPIHGDLHSGNVVVRRRRSGLAPVLIDWGRARVGSPLEDVSSWLQSLAVWEPEARRRHDTLFARYLRARGMAERLTTEIRESYWLAAASNVLSGALAYHLACARSPLLGRAERGAHAAQARDGLRIVARADAVFNA